MPTLAQNAATRTYSGRARLVPGRHLRKSALLCVSKSSDECRSKKEIDAVEVDESIIMERVQVHGGYAKPVLSELVIFAVFAWPYHLVKGIIWQYNWYVKYNIRKEEYSAEDKAFLTRSVISMSPGHWNGLEEKKVNEWLSKELWVEENARKWRESQKGHFE